jgi:hypothetical protein
MIKYIIFLTLVMQSVIAIAGDNVLSKIGIEQLDDAWWHCDYASTQSMVSPGDAASCSEIFEELKTRKFGGDFSEFMKWWKANKSAEHAKVAKKAG